MGCRSEKGVIKLKTSQGVPDCYTCNIYNLTAGVTIRYGLGKRVTWAKLDRDMHGKSKFNSKILVNQIYLNERGVARLKASRGYLIVTPTIFHM